MSLLLASFHVRDVGVDGLSRVLQLSDGSKGDFGTLFARFGISEGFSLSTCNRIEFFLSSNSNEGSQRFVDSFPLCPYILIDSKKILQHLLAVAVSRDSVVFGENQILGQFKRAYEQGLQSQRIGPVLSPILNLVISEAKALRTRYPLTQSPTSVATVAAGKIHSSLRSLSPQDEASKKTILFLGAGETNQILARYLAKRGDYQFYWTSRSGIRAARAANDLGGQAVDWQCVLNGKSIPQVDAISAATHSQSILFDRVHVEKSKARIVCDLSVPANVSRNACKNHGSIYFGMDELNLDLLLCRDKAREASKVLDVAIMESVHRMSQCCLERELRKRITDTNHSRLDEFALDRLLDTEFTDLNEERKSSLRRFFVRLNKNETIKTSLKTYAT